MRESEGVPETPENSRWQTGWQNPSRGDSNPRIPGSVWKNRRTGGFYWTIRSDLVPPEARGKVRYSKIPLTALGGRPGATRNRDIALRCQKRLWHEWAARLSPGVSLARPGDASLDHWLAEFRQFNGLNASADHADYNCLIARRAFALPGMAVQRCHEISDRHVTAYLASLQAAGRSLRTVQAHRNALHKFCRFLCRRGVIDGNPVDLVDVASPPKRPPRFLDDWQRIAALDALSGDLPDWMFDAVCVALFSGARLGSIMALACEHVQPAALVLPLPKVGDYSIVPLDSPIIGPELGAVLRRVRGDRSRGSLFPEHTQQWWVKRLRDSTRRLRLPVFGELPGSRAGNQWHLLRSTWAVNCARRGATLWQLMEWGGWRIPTTVMRYVNIARAAGAGTPLPFSGEVGGGGNLHGG